MFIILGINKTTDSTGIDKYLKLSTFWILNPFCVCGSC